MMRSVTRAFTHGTVLARAAIYRIRRSVGRGMDFVRVGGVEVRNFPQFFGVPEFSEFPASFPQLVFACPPRMCVGALCVPCAEVLLLEAPGGLVIFLQFSCNFSSISPNLPAIFLQFPAIFPQFPAIFRIWI